MSIVKYAKDKVEIEGSWKLGGYDQVYCVFDRDSHKDFLKARSMVFDLNKSRAFPAKSIRCICSFPCFEYWFLLHFGYTRGAFVKKGNKSPCDAVIDKLKKKLAGHSYEKRLSERLINELMKKLETAIVHSEKAYADAQNTNEFNPSTEVHILVSQLDDLTKSIANEAR